MKIDKKTEQDIAKENIEITKILVNKNLLPKQALDYIINKYKENNNVN